MPVKVKTHLDQSPIKGSLQIMRPFCITMEEEQLLCGLPIFHQGNIHVAFSKGDSKKEAHVFTKGATYLCSIIQQSQEGQHAF
jgi:hypothetical protein